MKRYYLLYLSFFLSSCFSVMTSDPEEAFEHWAGFEPPEEFIIKEGQYYKSPHFTYEFEVYLKLQPTDEWRDKLIEQFNLSPDYASWTKPSDAPKWFNPESDAIMYSRHDEFDVSRFFIRRATKEIYIYQVQF